VILELKIIKLVIMTREIFLSIFPYLIKKKFLRKLTQ
jgi:hypothetical protein